MRRHLAHVTVLAVSIAVLALGAVLSLVPSSAGTATETSGAVLGPGPVTVELDVHHSRFTPRVVRVLPHTEVRFVVVNRDPIAHELIVGDGEVHARHESGNEPTHPPVPGEVSIAANGRASTTYTFHEPGRVLYACHLPGHFAYGMRGTVLVEQP